MKKIIPNNHTIIACIEARTKFDNQKNVYYDSLNDAEKDIHNFNAGFNRGISWTINNLDKIEVIDK